MKCVLCLVVVCALMRVEGHNFVAGNIANRVKLAHHELVEYNAIPFIKRIKYYFYTQVDNQKIVGIQALDTMHTQASINITAGGVGYSFVNMRLKSERGRGISYDVGIYTMDDYI